MKNSQLVGVILFSASAVCFAITAVVRLADPDPTTGSALITPAAMLMATAAIVNFRAFRRVQKSPFCLRSDHHQSSHYATGSDRVVDAARAAVEEIATVTDVTTDAEGTTITAEVRGLVQG